MLGTTELLIIILVAAILIFGGKKVVEFSRSLGRAVGEFKKARLEAEMEVDELKKKKKEKK